MFDRGGFSINDDLTIIGIEAKKLTVHEEHKIDKSNFQYHRVIHGYD